MAFFSFWQVFLWNWLSQTASLLNHACNGLYEHYISRHLSHSGRMSKCLFFWCRNSVETVQKWCRKGAFWVQKRCKSGMRRGIQEQKMESQFTPGVKSAACSTGNRSRYREVWWWEYQEKCQNGRFRASTAHSGVVIDSTSRFQEISPDPLLAEMLLKPLSM